MAPVLKVEHLLHRALHSVVTTLFISRDLAGGDDAEEDHHGDRVLGGGGGGGDDDDHSEFGVHITYEDLYNSIIFFTTIYLAGQVASRLLKMPSLVGEIFAGILLGPPLADFVPNPLAFVMLGEIGLILLVLEAGIDIDLTTLKLIGARGLIIAIVGSILPIIFGMAIAFAIGTDTKGAIAAGASFGPTSLGIAMNILRQGKIVNTPVGQLIVSAAVIDDMIALIILSQLSALTGDITVASILIPVVSALGFLVIGGYIAVNYFPILVNRLVLSRIQQEYHGKVEMTIMLGLLIGLMPATYYAEASFLMGAFLAGLAFCRSHDLHAVFVSQFKRILQWLMRIFFAASIGFQVPIKDFGNGTVLWQGMLFTLALAGKIAVGFMVPNFNQTKRFTNLHLRDCLCTGFSMAAEGEFAFVIAVFAVDQGLISKDLYASIVLAVLISTIIPPFLLRYTINKYNRKSKQIVEQAAQEFEADLEQGVDLTASERDKQLRDGIVGQTAVFYCIQTQSESTWGLLPKIMGCMQKLRLEIIDHRSWHPRGVDTTLVNEIYARDTMRQDANHSMEDRIGDIQQALFDVINQPESAKVKVQRWYPGVVAEIVDEVEDKGEKKTSTTRRLTIQERLHKEASFRLEKDRTMQTNITKEKTLEELQKSVTLPEPTLGGAGAGGDDAENGTPKKRTPRRIRQKMRSTPVVGGSLFDDSSHGETGLFGERRREAEHTPVTAGGGTGTGGTNWRDFALRTPSGHTAELIVDGEVFRVRISPETLARVKRGYQGSMVDGRGISIHEVDAPIEQRLRGFVRSDTLAQIAEETVDDISDSASDKSSLNKMM